MLSKAPPVPVPQPGSSDVSEDKPANKEAGVLATSESAELAAAAGEELQNPPASNRIVEEAVPEEISMNANVRPEAGRAAREVPSSRATAQVQRRPETRVSKPTDDRLFTWAAIGLTLAIVVLLLKKFMKASAHGPVFMDES